MSTRTRVAIYARVSTDEQSLDSQLRDLREYCRARGWEATEYTDHGISGAKDSRPGWNACWDAMQKRRHSILLVHALDRIGRSLPHLVKIVTTMSEQSLTLISFRENLDLSSAAGRMLAGIFAVLADFERSIISDRTKAGMRAAKQRGSRIGNRKAYFDRGRAAELRAQGFGQIRIAKALSVGVGTVNRWVHARRIAEVAND